MARRFRPHGAQRRYGCCGTADHGSRCRRPLYPERQQNLHHQRRLRTRLYRDGDDRQVAGYARYLGIHCRARLPRFLDRQEREEDGYPRFGDLRADFRELHRSQGESARQGRQGLQHRYEDPRWRPRRYRFASPRHRAGGDGRNREIRQGAQTVRTDDRTVPEHPVPTGRPGYQNRSCPPAGTCSSLQERPEAPILGRCRPGQALCSGNRNGSDDQGRAIPRRIRLHARIPR